MTSLELIALIQGVRVLGQLIESESDILRRKGEMTPEAEAAYQAHQKDVYSRPEAQPEPLPPPS